MVNNLEKLQSNYHNSKLFLIVYSALCLVAGLLSYSGVCDSYSISTELQFNILVFGVTSLASFSYFYLKHKAAYLSAN